ncbi:MAG: TlyA family RNA methyltransferase [Deltaproteobacteria bacterium]|nr:TlyA family RNA methyltransferase [Deltaproteobacteria bacterium]
MVQKGLAESREKAKAIIMAGEVMIDGTRADKPGHIFPEESEITIKTPSMPFVSRGGLKLEAAINHFNIDVKDLVMLDTGASTGGFTDCLLQHGAKRVIAIDVGYGQMHWRLRNDPRVTVIEKTNARNITPDTISEQPDGAVIDVSFISLKLVIPPVAALLPENTFIIALIKPQFEAGKGEVGKGGVVRDEETHNRIIVDISDFCKKQGLAPVGVIPSPILGPKGNREFLIYLKRQTCYVP